MRKESQPRMAGNKPAKSERNTPFSTPITIRSSQNKR